MSAPGPHSESSPPPRSAVRVLSVPKIGGVSVRFLANYSGLFTHHKSGHTIPCKGIGSCDPAAHKLPCIWKGYAPVLAWDEVERVWFPKVLEVTENLEEQLRGRNLRGEIWLLTRREKNGKTDPVEGVYCETLSDAATGKAFDVRPVLCRLWHVGEVQLGVSNPLTPRMLLEAVAGDAPKLPAPQLPADQVEDDAERRRKNDELLKRFRKNGYRPPATDEVQSSNGRNH